MQLNAVVRIEDGQVAAERFCFLEQREICQHMVDAPAGRTHERRLAAAAAEHLPQTALRIRVVLLRSQQDHIVALYLGHGIPVGDHEIRMQTERPRMPQAAVRTRNERVRMLAQKRADVTVIGFRCSRKNQRVPPLVSSHSFRSFTLSYSFT